MASKILFYWNVDSLSSQLHCLKQNKLEIYTKIKKIYNPNFRTFG